jgi:hypothetical protein
MEPIMEGGRVAPTRLNTLPKPGQADTLWPDKHAATESSQVLPTDAERHDDSAPAGSKQETLRSTTSVHVGSQEEALPLERSRDGVVDDPTGRGQSQNRDQNRNTSSTMLVDGITKDSGRGPSLVSTIPDLDNIDFWEPRPPKVLMKHPGGTPLELRSQIQHYATTE